MSVSMFDCNIESVNTFKYLGIILATDFTWSDHVEHVITKVNQRLSLLRRIKHFLPLTARVHFYYTVILYFLFLITPMLYGVTRTMYRL